MRVLRASHSHLALFDPSGLLAAVCARARPAGRRPPMPTQAIEACGEEACCSRLSRSTSRWACVYGSGKTTEPARAAALLLALALAPLRRHRPTRRPTASPSMARPPMSGNASPHFCHLQRRPQPARQAGEELLVHGHAGPRCTPAERRWFHFNPEVAQRVPLSGLHGLGSGQAPRSG